MSGSFIVNENDYNIFIQNTDKDKLIIAISKIDAEIILLNNETSKEIIMNNHYSIYGIMGILNICSVPCLIVITKALDFTKGKNEIFKIVEIKYIILNKNIDDQKKIDIENNFKIYSENINYSSIFFSNCFDLSNPYSKNKEEKNNLFLYNYDMLEPFYNEKNEKINLFCCKCIYGYSFFFQNKIGGVEIKFYFISKKKRLNEEIEIYQNEVLFTLSNGDCYNFTLYSSYNNKYLTPFSVEKMNELNIISSTFITGNLNLIEENTKEHYNIINLFKDSIENEIEKIGYFYKKTTQIFTNSFYSGNSCLQKSDCILVCENNDEMIQFIKIIIFENVLSCFRNFNIPPESQNNFYGYFYAVEDKPKQNYIDLMSIINFSQELNKFIAEFDNTLKIQENKKPEISKFIEIKKEINFNKTKIYILTFNLAGSASHYVKTDNSDFNIENLLFSEKHKNNISIENTPEIFCIGFQEIVELNVSNIVFKSNISSVNSWTEKITNILFNKCKYQLIVKMSMVGILLLIFVKNSILPFISEINVSSCKTGFAKGMLGNKGYIISQFNFKGKYFGFCSGHLSAGENKVNLEQRQKEIKSIFDFNNVYSRKNKFVLNDYFFIFGDLNFRIDFAKEDISNENSIERNEMIQYKDILLKRDELNFFLNEYKNVKEGKINFLPTYKFIKHLDKYDLSKKVPAWTDRILFGNNDELNYLNQIFYDDISEINISDHRPVSSLFEIKLYNK